mgnify:CR=1 FL=1
MVTMIALLVGVSFQQEPITLFDGKSLQGWTADVPDLDGKPSEPKPFIARNGMLVSLGTPMGHLITTGEYADYKLTIEYRYSKEAGNSGVIVHASKPRALNNFLPQGIEVQLRSGNAGDFHMFNETLKHESPREGDGTRKLVNFTDDSESKIGEWNTMIIECNADTIKVWCNKDLVNVGVASSIRKGKIALQSEGAEVEFRKMELMPLK